MNHQSTLKAFWGALLAEPCGPKPGRRRDHFTSRSVRITNTVTKSIHSYCHLVSVFSNVSPLLFQQLATAILKVNR